ncbi:hypothetical protein [Hymenobacter latericus]|uniref:hypothetical protein n=1 Tax=Hymenobacter sp. YIM 151858-1 TaxID=2987688 RepID=UPI002225BCDE|nr:hypothetical protein [Hymenobacter sp. YIM 151858-1]UYZ59547.1 hypothetical protein OIS50_01815 [Hymenobacter sp. YIM 151858-1]
MLEVKTENGIRLVNPNYIVGARWVSKTSVLIQMQREHLDAVVAFDSAEAAQEFWDKLKGKTGKEGSVYDTRGLLEF